MNTKIVHVGFLSAALSTSFPGYAATFPVNDANNAIYIGKMICRAATAPNGVSTAKWRSFIASQPLHAYLASASDNWIAYAGEWRAGGGLWVVKIPKQGPAPKDCNPVAIGGVDLQPKT